MTKLHKIDNWSSLLTVKGDKFVIRPYQDSDAEYLSKAANSAKVARYLRTSFPHPYTLENAKLFINHCQTNSYKKFQTITENSQENEKKTDDGSLDRLVLTIVSSDKGIVMGGIGVYRNLVDPYIAEVGYWINEEHWGKQIMTSALGLFIKHIIFSDQMGHVFGDIVRLESKICVENIASVRVCEKNGFLNEGKHRKAHKNNHNIQLCVTKLLKFDNISFLKTILYFFLSNFVQNIKNCNFDIFWINMSYKLRLTEQKKGFFFFFLLTVRDIALLPPATNSVCWLNRLSTLEKKKEMNCFGCYASLCKRKLLNGVQLPVSERMYRFEIYLFIYFNILNYDLFDNSSDKSRKKKEEKFYILASMKKKLGLKSSPHGFKKLHSVFTLI
ncbi:acetyltransferase, partial [Reticulomyxa filosa]